MVPTIRTIGRKNTLPVQMVSNSLTLPKKSQILRTKAKKEKGNIEFVLRGPNSIDWLFEGTSFLDCVLGQGAKKKSLYLELYIL